MSCATCGDKGMVTLNWSDAPPDYAVCLCPIGLGMRAERNNGKAVAPLWLVWASLHQVQPSRIYLLEEALTPDELRAAAFTAPTQTPDTREAALLAAGRRGKR